MTRVSILGIGFDRVTMAEAVARCGVFLGEGRPRMIVTPNAEIVYRATREPELAALLEQADLVVADGAGVVLASRLLGDPLPERVTGVDLTVRLLAELSQRGGRLFLLGARPEAVAEAARRVRAAYPGIAAVGCRDGFFTAADEPEVLTAVRAFQPDLLLAGMGFPRQEEWLARYLPELGHGVGMGVGGTIDTLAGLSRRAPAWVQRANLEWLWRIIKLGRVGRSLPPLIKFAVAVTGRRLRR